MEHLEETVKLLNHIQKNPQFTQRELVEELGVSLGKVNFLINALTEKGIIKLKKFKNSRKKAAYLYLITPVGIKEKMRFTREFFKKKLEEYSKLKEELSRLKRETGSELRR